jgi:squalene-hopene/tetraprenyl-beta-curcumene cyclase
MDLGTVTGSSPDLDKSISGAVDALWAAQRADGSWEGYLPSSSLSTASVVLAFWVADREGARDLIEGGVEWLIADQNADGGWGDVPGGPSTVNGTAIALSAVNVARPEATEVLDRAKAALERLGGRDAVEDMTKATLNVIVRTYLAFAGLYDPDRVPRIPIEIVLLPHRLHQRVSFILPGVYAWAVMQVHTRSFGRLRRRINAASEGRTIEYLRTMAEVEGPDGGSEESAFMVALIVFGLGLADRGHDILEKYLRYLRTSVRPDGSWPIDRDLELSGTCYVGQGLQEAGFASDERLLPTVQWIKAQQRQITWPATGSPPGGWGWAQPSGWPDVDDTSLAVSTLARAGLGADDPHVAAGVDWLHAMRNRNGSWGCFIRNGRSMFDAPCAALTGHAMMALTDVPGRDHRLDRAVRWLGKAQQDDGALASVWFRGLSAGTAHVLDALGQAGLGRDPVAAGSLRWLLANQRPDGGWGDGLGLPSSVEETAWSLLALTRLGYRTAETEAAAERAAGYLTGSQRPDGLWDGSQVGYYFNGLTYWCDGMVNGYALQALARYRAW